MSPELLEFLSASARTDVFAMANECVGDVPVPSTIVALRKRLPDFLVPHASLVVDIVMGTRRAQRLGKYHGGWLFTNRMAEQCTHPSIAAHHASRYAGCRSVVEICTGAGQDALAMAAVAGHVTTYEADAVVAALASGNMRASGVHNVTVVAQAWQGGALAGEGLWADPSRRDAARQRVREAARYDPPLHDIGKATHGPVGIKIGPGDIVGNDSAGMYASEYIGYGRECRERILWRHEGVPVVSVTLVDAGMRWVPSAAARASVGGPAPYLIEPHNALVASGYVGEFIAEIGGTLLDEHIAYAWMSEKPATSAWYDAYVVVDVEQGISAKKVQQRIRQYGWNARTEFKKRGWPEDPETLRRGAEFSHGATAGVVIIARVGKGHCTIYAERL